MPLSFLEFRQLHYNNLWGDIMLDQSYSHGASTKPLIGETLGANFDAAVKKWGKRDALIVRHQNIRWTYLELQEKVNAVSYTHLTLPTKRIV